jgi:RNA polymerase subunit RPABC4/transcription elongation factor Spt4
MTQAVCFKCGEIKQGAFTDCLHCGSTPVTEDWLFLSLTMTDRYFELATMNQMGVALAEGAPPHLDEKSRQDLLKQLENVHKTLSRRFLGGGASASTMK